ncbi:uncharacterized protein LOC128032575 [Gossypium raimondii]|uniref:uncharacterized protein LOC128032575 n=1 Tax=Gossypium raimondii TaxID=29730 RepID=UPI00227C8454|nr:uncharacterized protein LOC128032575 [Gossypium raimondii]
MLTEAPILTLPKSGKDFVVYSDASLNGLGCELMQDGKVIAYASRQLKQHEHYHPGKANVVADTLSRKSADELGEMFAQLGIDNDGSLLAELKVKLVMFDQIRAAQMEDKKIMKKREMVQHGTVENFSIDDHDCLRFQNRICTPATSEIKELIL